jgi:hypothetical protein
MNEKSAEPHSRYERLLAAALELPPIATAVVHPCDVVSLSRADSLLARMASCAAASLLADARRGEQAKALKAPAR